LAGAALRRILARMTQAAPNRTPARTPRGPNAQRRAETRGKIMDAAVRALAEFGYAATSTPLVARMAKVSRGSLLHQFPTKVDLVLAVAGHAARAQGDFIRAQVMAHPAGRARFVGGVAAVWQALQRPEAIALMEVTLAARTDAELAQRYPGFAADLEAAMRRARQRMAEGLGAPERAGEVDAMAHLTLAALRGLAMESVFIGRPAGEVEDVVGLLEDLRRRMADDLKA
jgi:AcrR family transcriptional regulator